MTWFSKKPFVALLLSMVLVAVLPLLLNSLFYVRFQNTVLEQQEALTEESLRLSVQEIDETLLELTTLGIKLEDELRGVEIPLKDKMDAAARLRLAELSKSLHRSAGSGSKYIERLYVYSAEAHRAVETDSVDDEEILYQKCYANRDVPREKMEQIHTTLSYGQIVPLENNGMVFIRTLSRDEKGLPGKQLVIILKQSFYKVLIDKVNVEGGIFILQDRKKELLAVSNKTGIELKPELLDEISQWQDSGNFSLQGEKALLYALRSDNGGYQVKAVIPLAQVLKPTQELRRFHWAFLATSVFLGILLALFLSHRNIVPVNQIIGYIRENYAGGFTESQGLEEIKSAVDGLLDQRRSAREQLLQYETLIARNDLRELLRGNPEESGAFSIPEGCRYVVVRFFTLQPMEDAGIRQIFSSQRVLPGECFCRMLVLDEYVIEILGGAQPEFDQQKAEELLTLQIDWLDQQDALAVNAAFSTVYEGVQNLERAYGEACIATASGYNTEAVLTCFASCKLESAYFLRDWHHLDKQLLFATQISKGKIRETMQILPELFPPEFMDDYFPGSDISSLHLASLKYQFLHDLNTMRDLLGLEDEKWSGFLQELVYCKTHRKLYGVMETLLREMESAGVGVPEQLSDGPAEDRVGEIKGYIRRNFADPQLNVSSVAEAFGMSSNSLSQLFSRKADCGVLDYIHRVRMERAGELLRENRKAAVQDVAAQVGYTSILTFNRKFKAFYQQTPREYQRGGGD